MRPFAFVIPALAVAALMGAPAVFAAEPGTTSTQPAAPAATQPATTATPPAAPAATKPATTTAKPATATAPTSTPEKVEHKVEHWTWRQWRKAKKEWIKDKAKWADCQHQAKAQKLSGRKSWSFLYSCMTKS